MPCSLRAGSPNLPSPNVLKEKSQQVQFPDGRDVALCKAMVSYKHWLTLTLFSFFFVITIPSSSSFSSVTSTFMKSRNGHIRTNFVRFPHRPLTFSDVLGQRKGEQKTNLAKTALCNESFTQMRIQQQIKGSEKIGVKQQIKKQLDQISAKFGRLSKFLPYQKGNEIPFKWSILPYTLKRSLLLWIGISLIVSVMAINICPLFFTSPKTIIRDFNSRPMWCFNIPNFLYSKNYEVSSSFPFPIAMAVPSSSSAASITKPLSSNELIKQGLVFLSLFVVSAALHSAETAITTLYPWKVKEFAGQEGPTSPFRILEKDITRVLTTILVATTSCTIYSAALFTTLANGMFGPKGIAYSTVGLTTFTLVFGELIPKALGVNNAELVARTMVPPINILAIVLNPLGKLLSMFAKTFLRLIGVRTEDKDRVSEEELRLLIAGAQKSGGIENEEGQMINSILNMHDTKVSEVMKPRVDVEAIQKEATLLDLQEKYDNTKYSRIPVYDEGIDKIIGVVMSKDLLDYVFEDKYVATDPVESIMQPTYFIPETMSVWNCFQEMRKRRNHMAIVVDEYGGTAGIVTLEDIQEEVFGEIYDEEDDEVDHSGEDLITVLDEENQIFQLQGNAEFADVCKALKIEGKVSEDLLDDFNTFSGYLCSLAGEIPAISDYIVVHNYIFTIIDADERRILEIRAERIEKEDDDDLQEGDNEGDRDRDRERDTSDSEIRIYEKGNGQINQLPTTNGSLDLSGRDKVENKKEDTKTKEKRKEGERLVVEVVADSCVKERDTKKQDHEFLPDELTDEIIIEESDSKLE